MAGFADDSRILNRAAAELGVTEFQVFALSYRNWYGRDAEDCRIERAFDRFLKTGDLPLWVRDYARKTQRAANDFSLAADRGNNRTGSVQLLLGWVKGVIVLASLMGIFLMLVLLANGAQEQISQHCILPVC